MKQRNDARSAWHRGWRCAIAATGLFAMSLAGGCGGGVSDDDIKLSSVVDVRAKQASLKDNDRAVLLIDSRSPAAYRERHIAGAINYTLAQVPSSKSALDKRLLGYESIIVYGNNRGDNGAKGLTKRLLELDYDDVYWFSEGLDEWVLAGGATEGVMVKP